MKKGLQRLVQGILSLIMTFLVMASPVAAIIYATEPAVQMSSFSISRTPIKTYVTTLVERLESPDDQAPFPVQAPPAVELPSYALKKGSALK